MLDKTPIRGDMRLIDRPEALGKFHMLDRTPIEGVVCGL